MLFRKYLELEGRLQAFNLDPQFNNTLDGLIFANLPPSNRRLLEFHMGETAQPGTLATIWRRPDSAAGRRGWRMGPKRVGGRREGS